MPVSDMTGDECFYVNFEVTHFEVAILQFWTRLHTENR